MRTTCTAEQIEDELGELKLRIAKMNARRNAQINLLQRNILEGSLRNKVYSKPNDILKRNYNPRYPSYYHWPLYPWKYSSMDNLLDPYYELDDITKKSVSFLSEKDLPVTYKTLERKAQSNIIAKLKRFVQDQENEITNEFADKLLYPRRPIYSPNLNYDKNDNIRNDLDTKLYSANRESPFLKPINKSDNFYKRYNSFMRRIMKPFRKTSPLSKSGDYKNPSSIATSQSTNWKYKRPLPLTTKYFPPKISKPLSPIKSSLDDLDAAYLRPWYKYSPIYRNFLHDYEYIPRNYRVPRDVDTIIRDMEFENRRTYPFVSTYPTTVTGRYNDLSAPLKYDPYESDSYVRSNLPTWKQYYYTQKLKSKPSHERLVDYYDPYRDFFCDAASIKSDDISISPNKEDFSEINSLYDDDYSFPEPTRSYDNLDDLQIIDSYRDLIYEDIIKNLRSQQSRSHLKNKANNGRKTQPPTRLYNPSVLRNDRSLYNYRITEPSLSNNYSWSKKPTALSNYTYNKLNTSDATSPYESKYNFLKSDSNKNTPPADDKSKPEKLGAENATSQPSPDENKFDSSKYNYLSDSKFVPPKSEPSVDENKFDSSKYDYLPNNKVISQKSEENPTSFSPTNDSKYSPRKYTANGLSTGPISGDFTYQKYKDMSPTGDYKTENKPTYDTNYKFTPQTKNENTLRNEENLFSNASTVTKLESPTKDSYNMHVTEKESSPVTTIRRSSVFDKQYADQLSPTRPTLSSNPPSPKKQPYVSNPPSPVRQFSDSSPPAPVSMSRKNSVQYPARRGSVKTSSIEEEPNAFPKIDRSRKYSRDQTSYTPELNVKSPNANQNAEKRLSYGGSIKESFDEEKEDKIDKEKYKAYPQYKDTENATQPKTYGSYNEDQQLTRSPSYNRPSQFQQYQSFDNTNPSYIPENTNAKYEEKPAPIDPSYSANYNRNIDPSNPQNYADERYYGDQQYDAAGNTSYKSYPEEYNQDQYNYTDASYNPQYDMKSRDPNIPYTENRSQYADPSYTNKEKRLSNEAYYTDPRPQDYEKYPDEDYNADYYKTNTRNSETRSSNYQNERYRAPDETYDEYRYQAQPYRDLPKTSSQESYGPGDPEQYPYESSPTRTSFENYSPNLANEKTSIDQNYPYSGPNSYENPDHPATENLLDPSTEKIVNPVPQNVVDSPKPVVSGDSKVKDRKKSSASDLPREPDTPTEPSPKDVPSSRRTSRAALTLAEQKKASTEKMTMAEKNKALKAKPAESKFKRQPSMMKAKPALKKT